MRQDAFGFLRGTCHLFYEDLDPGLLPEAPLVWCCGDLHLQNFGTYRGDNRLTYFDVNDFDEACLAPAAWDLVRFLASLLVGGKVLGMSGKVTRRLETTFLDGYASALCEGKALWVERATASGQIRALLSRLKRRTQKKFLASRTTLVKGRRQLLIDGKRALSLLPGEREMLTAFLKTFARKQRNPDRFQLVDAARRIAGAGSLGLARYALLVEGKGSPHGNFLLDLKVETGSAVLRTHHLPQPPWPTQAERVVGMQKQIQAISPALLTPIHLDGREWVLRELMPTDDRMDIHKWDDDVAGFVETVRTLGQVVAWGNLRSAGRRGAGLPDDLVRFGQSRDWATPLLQAARDAARRTEDQWREFVASF
ncbi:MAG: DUF2252 domain-containing protein [Acidobacteriia bacterium]|nr:DUF2252 domain-containing protein [Terriglobia bacterium]